MITKATFVNGGKNGAYITWELAKTIIPVYFLITFLKYTPVLGWIAQHFAPIMAVFGLPGDASLPLVLGNVLNPYFALAAIIPLDLTGKEITILSTMLLLSHSLFVETAINKKTGIKVKGIIVLRLGSAIIAGIMLNLFL